MRRRCDWALCGRRGLHGCLSTRRTKSDTWPSIPYCWCNSCIVSHRCPCEAVQANHTSENCASHGPGYVLSLLTSKAHGTTCAATTNSATSATADVTPRCCIDSTMTPMVPVSRCRGGKAENAGKTSVTLYVLAPLYRAHDCSCFSQMDKGCPDLARAHLGVDSASGCDC